MESRTILQLDEADLNAVLEEKLTALSRAAVLGQFAGRIVSADAAAEILGVHRNTLLSYAKAGLIECQHTGKLWKFQLSHILTINMHDLKKQK